MNNKPSTSLLSDGNVDLFHEGFLTGRQLEFICYRESSSSMLLCGYGPSNAPTIPNARQGCICVYNVLASLQPVKVLLLEGHPLCACWVVPMRRRSHNIIVVGTDSGSLALWDLLDESVSISTPQLVITLN